VKFEAVAENLNSWFSTLDDIDEPGAIVFVDEGNSTAVEGIFGAAMKFGDEETNIELMEGFGAIAECLRADCEECWEELAMYSFRSLGILSILGTAMGLEMKLFSFSMMRCSKEFAMMKLDLSCSSGKL
jgi:hypothetical protein